MKSAVLISHDTGLVAMAERILILLRDPELRRRMGQCGKETVESRFSAHSMMTQLAGVYDELLTSRK